MSDYEPKIKLSEKQSIKLDMSDDSGEDFSYFYEYFQERDSARQTLPTNSKERKNYPLLRGVIRYFPAALCGVAKVSKDGNDKHNPGEEMYHARGKSSDHGDCILRHLIDLQDLIASNERGALTSKGINDLLTEASSLAWRALALSQQLHENFGAPLAPGAKKD